MPFCIVTMGVSARAQILEIDRDSPDLVRLEREQHHIVHPCLARIRAANDVPRVYFASIFEYDFEPRALMASRFPRARSA